MFGKALREPKVAIVTTGLMKFDLTVTIPNPRTAPRSASPSPCRRTHAKQRPEKWGKSKDVSVCVRRSRAAAEATARPTMRSRLPESLL